MADANRDIIPGLSRFPTWSCGVCGTAGNWQCRRTCRGCARDPPKSVKDRQRDHLRSRGNGSQQPQGRTQSSWRTGSGNQLQAHGSQGRWPGGGFGGGGKVARGDGSTTAKTDGATRTYADAAKGRDWAAELAELRKANERLTRQVNTLRANGTGEDEDDDRMEDDSDEAAAAARDERIKVLEGGLGTLAAIYSEDSTQYKAAKEELSDLMRQRREAKPLRAQLQHLDRRIDKQRQRAERLQNKTDDIKEKISELQADLAESTAELDEANDVIASLEEERKSLLLKEAQQKDGNSEAAAGASGAGGAGPSADDAWTTVVQTIGLRLNQPGANQELGSQVTATVQLLRDLLAQLPPPMAGASAAAAPSGTMPGAASPTIPAAVAAAGTEAGSAGGERAATAAPPTPKVDGLGLATPGQGQSRRGQTQSSSCFQSVDATARDASDAAQERERSPRPRAGATRFRPHGRESPATAAQQIGEDTVSTEQAPIAHNATPPTSADAESSTSNRSVDTGGQPATQEAELPAPGAASTNGASRLHDEQAGAPTDDEELVESGDEDEDSSIAMDIERAIEKLPENQRRDKVREILAQRRKEPKARRLTSRKPSGTKKPHKQ